jgi:hypothetical protein
VLIARFLQRPCFLKTGLLAVFCDEVQHKHQHTMD